METRPAEHPPADVLLALGSGKLDDAAATAVFWHVEACEECIQIAARLSGDSFLDRLRAARDNSATPAPNKPLSRLPTSGNTAPIPTVSARPTPTVLPELRDHPQYEVIRELGRGGMGVVYLAKNKLMDRLEVLKVVNRQRLDDPEAAERFLREIRSAARLNHPNIVTAYSALQVGDLLLFGMEYVEGQDLARLVKARGQLPVGNACYYAQQTAQGLQHAYENNMVHRDIKPQNLILDGKKQVVKVLDFGLAKATRESGATASGLTGPNIMMGTPDYMAPEQTLRRRRGGHPGRRLRPRLHAVLPADGSRALPVRLPLGETPGAPDQGTGCAGEFTAGPIAGPGERGAAHDGQGPGGALSAAGGRGAG